MMKGNVIPHSVLLTGTIKSFGKIKGVIALPKETAELYVGSYNVTPTFDQQILETIDKRMADNVCVESIPYSEVSNDSGGKTINIGG